MNQRTPRFRSPYDRRFAFPAVAILLLALTQTCIAAPPVIWDGGGADNFWSTPENWSGDQEPTVFDDVIMDGTSSRDCQVNLNQTMLSFTMRAAYTGTLSFVAGEFSVDGDTLIEGGMINWGGAQRRFRGDFTRTAGATSGGSFYFEGTGVQDYRPGPTPTTYSLQVSGGPTQQFNLLGDLNLNQGGYSVNIYNGATANFYGAVNLGQSDPIYVSGSGTTVNLQSGSTITLATGGSIDISTADAVVNVLGGAVLDARRAIGYENRGRVIETGGGRVRRHATGVGFTDASGNQVDVVPVGTPIYVTLFDDDENVNGSIRDTAQVVVRSLTTGDQETLTLTETDVLSGVFRNTTGLPTAAGGPNPGNGTLQLNGAENLEADYQDNEDAGDRLVGLLVRTPIPWDGGGADDAWSTPENWVGDRAPSVFDSVIFNNTSARNCLIQQNQEMFDFTMTSGYTGTMSFNAGEFFVNGDLLVDGGTINWGGAQRHFRGDFTRTSGAMSGGSFYFDGPGTQNYRPGPSLTTYSLQVSGGPAQILNLYGDVALNQGGYSVNVYNGSTFNIYGNIRLAQSDPIYISGAGTTVNIQSGSTVTLSTGGSFDLSTADAMLNVLDGGVFDARPATGFDNRGRVVETGTGRVLKPSSGVGFTDASGVRVASVPVGGSIYVTLFDEDENVNGAVRDTAQVTVESLVTGDRETITLTETDVQTEVLRNSVAFPTAAGAAALNNGVLQHNGAENLRVTYTDNEDSSDSINALLVRPPVIWDGGGADDRWITPENWDTNRVPMVYDNVRFDGTSSRSCRVTQNAEMFDYTMTSGYMGTLSFDAGEFIVNGDFSVGGGTISWGGAQRRFRGHWTRTGGVMSGGSFYFEGTGTQNYTPGPSLTTYSLQVSGGPSQSFNLIGSVTLNQGGYSVNIYNGATANIYGTVNLGQSDPMYISGSGTTVNLHPGTRFNFGVGGSLDLSSTDATLNVMNGAVLDALRTTGYDNRGHIREIGTGVILRNSTGVGFTTPQGILVPNIPAGTDIYISMLDEDENLEGGVRDAAQVVLRNVTSGDVETINLMETEVLSETFRNTAGFPSICGFAQQNNGIFEGQDGDSLEIRYTDSEDPNDVLVFFTTFVGGCTDCNSNGVDDADDITGATSDDCNTNNLPDECDIASGASQDANGNGVPDECDPSCMAPTISVQPQSRVVCAGASVTLGVTAAGSTPLGYQWRRNGVGQPGATAPSLAFAAAQPADVGTYDVVVQNGCGSVVSDAATLIVWETGTGDLNGDGVDNGLDIAALVRVLLTGPTGQPELERCAADLTQDGQVTVADVPPFMASLLTP